MDIQGLIHSASAIVDAAKAVVPAALLVVAAVGGVLKAVESVIQIIAPLTSWKWDDNLATSLGKLLANKIFQKKD